MGRSIGGDWACVRLCLVTENYLPRSAKGDPQGQDQPAGSDDGKTPGIQGYGGAHDLVLFDANVRRVRRGHRVRTTPLLVGFFIAA